MIHGLTAADTAARIRTGQLTSEALVSACLARIDAREAEVGACQHLARDKAMAEARAADRTRPRGALHGLPIGVKDIIDTVDMPTTLGSPLYDARRPQWDAACVAAAREAGTGDPLMSRMWTALHVPGLAVPMGKGPLGLPVGVQLIAAEGADELLLQVGLWASRALAAT